MSIVEIAAVAVGIAAVALSAVGLLAARDTFLRLHYLGPASVLGAPLVVAGLVVHEGVGTTAMKLVVIAVLTAGSGAVTVSALGRATARRDGLLDAEPPR